MARDARADCEQDQSEGGLGSCRWPKRYFLHGGNGLCWIRVFQSLLPARFPVSALGTKYGLS